MKKTCSRCQVSKEVECFNRRARSRDGLGPYCKDCKKAYDEERRRKKVAAVGEKVCTGCRVLKSVDQFHKHSQRKDGLDSRCRYCRMVYDHERKKRKVRENGGRVVV